MQNLPTTQPRIRLSRMPVRISTLLLQSAMPRLQMQERSRLNLTSTTATRANLKTRLRSSQSLRQPFPLSTQTNTQQPLPNIRATLPHSARTGRMRKANTPTLMHSFHRQYRQELTRPPQRLTLTQRTLQGRLQRAAMRTQRAIRGISSRLSLTR